MNQDIKKLWVDALRSGDYEQGRNRLYHEDTYCCLGVLCKITDSPLETRDMLLPAEAMNEAGLPDPDPIIEYKGEKRGLTGLNDNDKLTFPQIADLIEEQL